MRHPAVELRREAEREPASVEALLRPLRSRFDREGKNAFTIQPTQNALAFWREKYE
mgnify:CR=1 FL=1